LLIGGGIYLERKKLSINSNASSEMNGK
jgi:hypothetical protein